MIKIRVSYDIMLDENNIEEALETVKLDVGDFLDDLYNYSKIEVIEDDIL